MRTLQVNSYLTAALGAGRFAAISEALARPSLRPTLRVNTLRTSPAAVVSELRQLLGDAAVAAHPHAVVPSAVVLPGSGPNQPRYEELCGELLVLYNAADSSSALRLALSKHPGSGFRV